MMLTWNLVKFKSVALCRTINQVKTVLKENLKLREAGGKLNVNRK